MTTLPADLAALLARVRRPGDFFAADTAELLAPLLQVEGVGPVALPTNWPPWPNRRPMAAARRP